MSQSGIYKITEQKLDGNLATLGEEPFSRVVVVTSNSEVPQVEEWILEVLSDKNVTLRNKKSGFYIGFEGDPRENKEIVVTPEPRPWRLQNSRIENTFFIVVPGGPVDGNELALDRSLLEIFPPRTALSPLKSDDDSQAWKFIKLDY